MMAYKMLGIQTATSGEACPLMANVADTFIKKMYEKLNSSPNPKCSPIPPFTFLEANDNPILVRINDAAIMA